MTQQRTHDTGANVVAWLTDLRYALRSLSRQPSFSIAVIVTLALGISSATAIYTVVDSLMLRPVPFQEPERLVSLRGDRGNRMDLDVLAVWRERSDVFEDVRAHGGFSVIFTGAGEASSYRVEAMEPGLLELLGVLPTLGRTFTEEHAVQGNHRVVLLTDQVWREAFGADRNVVGRTVELNGEGHIVLGVLPPSVRRMPGGVVHLVVPLTDPPIWGVAQASGLARLRPGLTLEAAAERLQRIREFLDREQPREGGWQVSLASLERPLGPERAAGFRALFAAALCLLLIACSNAAGLLFLRGVTRRPELALRLALGSSRGALVRQVFAESTILALTAGALGTLLAWAGVRGLATLLPPALIDFSYTTVTMGGRVLAFAIVTTLLTGIVFGVLPAVRAASTSGTRAGRTTTASRSEVRVRAMLQVGQLALAVLLLAGAGLFGRSFLRLSAVPIGYDADRLLELQLVSLERLHGDPERTAAFARELDERLRALPGVGGIARRGGSTFLVDFTIEFEDGRRIMPEWTPPYLLSTNVDLAYFDVVGISLVEGRGFAADDLVSESSSVVVDADMARVLWPGKSAVGRRFRVREGAWQTVVGVSGDVKLEGPDDPLGPVLYFRPDEQSELRNGTVLIRTAGDPAALIPAVRAAVHELDAAQPISSLQTGREAFGEYVADPRFLLVIMLAFAAVALTLAVVGIYGLVSFAVAQRTREIGVRMALGARAWRVMAEVLGRGLVLGLIGVALGLGGAALLTRFISSLLFGVSPADPLALVLAGMVLLAGCAAALVLPARRAALVDPIEALRAE